MHKVRQSRTKNKSLKVFCAFSIGTCPSERGHALEQLSKNPLCTIEPHRLPFRQYITKMRQHAFTACPRGNSMESCRTSEALYMGSYPIIKTSEYLKVYDDLPVLVVNDWCDITHELLNSAVYYFGQDYFGQDYYSLSKLTMRYWFDKINRKRTKLGL